MPRNKRDYSASPTRPIARITTQLKNRNTSTAWDRLRIRSALRAPQIINMPYKILISMGSSAACINKSKSSGTSLTMLISRQGASQITRLNLRTRAWVQLRKITLEVCLRLTGTPLPVPMARIKNKAAKYRGIRLLWRSIKNRIKFWE